MEGSMDAAALWAGFLLLTVAVIGCFMWSVASSLSRISRNVERLANHRSLEREANPHEVKPVQVDQEWPVTP
jgi:hypothetical protein